MILVQNFIQIRPVVLEFTAKKGKTGFSLYVEQISRFSDVYIRILRRESENQGGGSNVNCDESIYSGLFDDIG